MCVWVFHFSDLLFWKSNSFLWLSDIAFKKIYSLCSCNGSLVPEIYKMYLKLLEHLHSSGGFGAHLNILLHICDYRNFLCYVYCYIKGMLWWFLLNIYKRIIILTYKETMLSIAICKFFKAKSLVWMQLLVEDILL